MNTTPRKVSQIIKPEFVIEGAGVLLQRSFAPARANNFDPFLLFDHFAFNDPIEGPIKGFPTHPHRGIETVTYMLKGNVRHRDSLGNVGVIGPGDVQWMTSGGGILHEEMPRRGPEGLVNGFQLWVNLPSTEKMSMPRYQEVSEDMIPVVDQDGIKIRLVAGEYGGVEGPVTQIAARPLYIDVTLEQGSEINLPVPSGHTAVSYVFEGEGVFGLDEHHQGESVQAVHMVVFDDGDHMRARAGAASPVRFMFIAGAPIREPIVPYGPFVMNTEAEIHQVFADLRNGTFAKY